MRTAFPVAPRGSTTVRSYKLRAVLLGPRRLPGALWGRSKLTGPAVPNVHELGDPASCPNLPKTSCSRIGDGVWNASPRGGRIANSAHVGRSAGRHVRTRLGRPEHAVGTPRSRPIGCRGDRGEVRPTCYMVRDVKPPSRSRRIFPDTEVHDLMAVDPFAALTAAFPGLPLPRHLRYPS